MIRDPGRPSSPPPRPWRPFLFAHLPGLALALLTLSSCASSGGRSSGLPSKSSKFLGTITFHDPRPPRGVFRPNDRRPPVTVSFGTTPRVEQGSNHDEVESGTVVSQGKIGEGFRRNQSLSPRVTQEIFKHTVSQRPHQIVTPSQLAKMRNGLIDAGIGELTRLDSGSPPANTAFIRVATETGQVTFLKPPRLTRQDSETTARDKRAKMDIWTRCILAMKSGTLRTDFIPGLRTNSSR